MSDKLNYIVRNSTDDAMEESGGSLTLTDTAIDLGDNGGSSFSGGFRFRNVDIPAGATIDEAYITLYSEANGSPTLNIYGEDEDNPATFEDDTGLKVLDRTLTTAFVAWDVTWTSSEEYKQSPDIKTVIQEIIDRSGWRRGNSIVIIVKDDSSSGNYAQVSSYDGEPNQTAILTVKYSNVSTDDKYGRKDTYQRNVKSKEPAVRADRIMEGTVTVLADVGNPDTGYIRIDGENNRIIVNDGSDNRVLIGDDGN